MNGAQLHLIVNHFPIIIPMMGLIIIIAGLILKSEILKRTAYSLFIFGAIAALAATITGDSAEEVVDEINGISKNLIKSHEEAADIFSVISYILGALSLVGLWANLKRKAFEKTLAFIILGVSLPVIFYSTIIGTSGGKIRHSEIRNDITNPVSNDINSRDDDDDDDDD